MGTCRKIGVEVYTDSDWATCQTTRRSRSGGVIYYNGYSVMHFCRTQDTVALSSGEAELKATCKGVAEGLAILELARFLGWPDCPFTHYTDASACAGILRRKGSGSIKHLTVKQLWTQEVFRRKAHVTLKIPRADNMSDALCRAGTVETLKRHLERMGFGTGRKI